MNDKYLLKYRKPVLCHSLIKWANWFETARRRVRLTCLTKTDHISTVFLSIDHNYGNGPPLLFETMIFRNGDFTGESQTRCSTWRQALKMHWEGVEVLKQQLDNEKGRREN
jgi:hypothetical protein